MSDPEPKPAAPLVPVPPAQLPPHDIPSAPAGSPPAGTFLSFQGEVRVSPYLSPEDLRAYRELCGEEVFRRLVDHNIACVDLLNKRQGKGAEHRQQIEQRSLDAALEDRKRARDLQGRGQLLAALLIVPMGLAAAVVLGHFGREWAACVVGGVPLVLLALGFLRSGQMPGPPKPIAKSNS